MNDKTGFDLIDKAFQEDLEKARRAERAKLELEIKEGKNPKFTQSHTDWMLARYPYANEEQRDKAVSAEEEKRRRQKEAFDNEVEKRLGEQKAILEQLHFGKEGRQFALDQAAREEKIQAFKERQQKEKEHEEKERKRTTEQSKAQGEALALEQKDKRAPEQNNAKQVNMRSDFNTETQQGKGEVDRKLKIERFKERQRQAPEQGKDQSKGQEAQASKPEKKHPVHLKDDFNRSSSEAEYDEWKTKACESKKEEFKQRLRKNFNTEKSKEKSAGIDHEM
jgi:hypothetical protein